MARAAREAYHPSVAPIDPRGRVENERCQGPVANPPSQTEAPLTLGLGSVRDAATETVRDAVTRAATLPPMRGGEVSTVQGEFGDRGVYTA